MNCFLFFGRMVFFSVFCFYATGCATILHGTRQDVAVTSDPPGAIVSDGETFLETPTKLNLKRDQDYFLTITKNGFEAEGVKVVHVVSGAVIANLLAPGGIIGMGIDNANGASYELEPNTLSVTLRPLTENETTDGGKKPSIATLAGKLEELNGLREKAFITQEEYKAMRAMVVRSVAG